MNIELPLQKDNSTKIRLPHEGVEGKIFHDDNTLAGSISPCFGGEIEIVIVGESENETYTIQYRDIWNQVCETIGKPSLKLP